MQPGRSIVHDQGTCDNDHAIGGKFGNGRVFSSPAVDIGIVYIGSGDSFIYALDADTGRLLWRTTFGGGILSSPALAGDLIIVGSSDGHLYALQRQDGTIAWNFLVQARTPVWTSPAVIGNSIYFGAHDGAIYALEGT